MDTYREEILTGLVVSAGGLGESLVQPKKTFLMQTRAASIALADYIDSISDRDLIAILKCMEGILQANLQNDRVVIPAVETIAGLFEENIFSRIDHHYECYLSVIVLT
jgi:Tubulin folding cofactor D C terminal